MCQYDLKRPLRATKEINKNSKQNIRHLNETLATTNTFCIKLKNQRYMLCMPFKKK